MPDVNAAQHRRAIAACGRTGALNPSGQRQPWTLEDLHAAARRALLPEEPPTTAELAAELREHTEGIREQGLGLEVELLLTRSQQLDAAKARLDARQAGLDGLQARLELGRRTLDAREAAGKRQAEAVVRHRIAIRIWVLVNALITLSLLGLTLWRLL
jgi:hypothetical protein